MKNKKHLSMLLAFAMIFNLFAFSGSAAASSLENHMVYENESDTNPYITEDDTNPDINEHDIKAPEIKAQTVLDIGRGNITISQGSVTGFLPNGTAATVNPNGYEITGSTFSNKIVVNDAVPITINGMTLKYTSNNIGSAINLVGGGEITVTGINTINRADQSTDHGLIGQDNGFITISGTGTLNINDSEIRGTTIGGNATKEGKVRVSGNVTINAVKTNGAESPVIGAGYNSNRTATIFVMDNPKINASINGVSTSAVIGSGNMGGDADITISGKPEIVAIGGTGNTTGAAIGSGNNANAQVFATIDNGASIRAVSRSTATTSNAAGMGLPESAPIINGSSRTDIQVGHLVNLDTPARETYYKALDGATPIYRATAIGYIPNTVVNVTYDGVSASLKAFDDRTIKIYLPAGEQNVTIDGKAYHARVTSDGGAVLRQFTDGIRTVLDISRGNITITGISVTAKTPNGSNATFDADGYEITGNSTTNKIEILDAVPITLSGLTLNYSNPNTGSAIRLVDGGEITVSGINTITRVTQTTNTGAIAQDSGILSIKGDGILNMNDDEDRGVIIGGNEGVDGDISISGAVTINAARASISDAPVIGGGVGSRGITKIAISGNAKVNASQNNVSHAAVIGISTDSTGSANIIISGQAQVKAIGGTGGTTAATIGTGNNANSTTNITIEDGTHVKVSSRATFAPFRGAGMGIPALAQINTVATKTNVKISQLAYVDAPKNENYYKALDGSTSVYKATANNLVPNTIVDLAYNNKTSQVKVDENGKLYLYLPIGRQVVLIGRDSYIGRVTTDGQAVLNLATTDGVRGKLDIGRGHITITDIGVTAVTPDGTPAPFDGDGYEIVGRTDTNRAAIYDAVPITLNGIALDYNIRQEGTAINMVNGGEITIAGVNTINRAIQNGSNTLIGQDSGQLILTGNGTLNITDAEDWGATIGGNHLKPANLKISGSVKINAIKTADDNRGPVIGGGYGSDPDNTIVITDNVKVDATISGVTVASVIGSAAQSNNDAHITISGKAEVTATGGTGSSNAAVIGVTGGSNLNVARITINDEAKVRVVNRVETFGTIAPGMGISKATAINHQVTSRVDIKISPFANVDAPARENYYKALNGTTPVYKTTASGFTPNTNVVITHSGKTFPVKTFEDGKVYLYLPVGEQNVTIDGIPLKGIVDASGNSILGRVNLLTAESLEDYTANGIAGIDLTGHATSNSDAPITYAITNAGTTGATLTGNILKWNNAGTIALNAIQPALGLYANGIAPFNVVITTPVPDNIRGKLDISKGNITITANSITAKTTTGANAKLDPDGYEIVGETDTNKISIRDAVPITITDIILNYKTDIVGAGINMVNGGEITVAGTNTLNRTLQTENNGLIGQDSGQILLKGDGTLNITDGENNGATIGGNENKPGNIWVGGSVNINAVRTISTSNGTIIGGGYNVSGDLATVVITENAKINATVDGVSHAAVIGLATKGTANITISGKAQVIATGGTGLTQASVIGTNRVAGSIANITIEDGTSVQVVSRSEATSTEAAGMGIPKNATITSDMIARSIIKISPFANVDAPARENYYKDLAGNTLVYKATAIGLTPNSVVNVNHSAKTVPLHIFEDGKLSLYLPVGDKTVIIDAIKFQGTVDTTGDSALLRENVLVANDIEKDITFGKDGVDLTGHVQSPSTGAMTYTVTDPGESGATITDNILKWTAKGTVVIGVTQVSTDLYAAGTATFNVVIVLPPSDGIRGKLDISKANITITGISVTAKTEAGTDALFDIDGYEIVGATQTNKIVVRDAIPITINNINLDYNTSNIGSAINMVHGGEITLTGISSIARSNQAESSGLIGQDSGTISIKGTGTLNITDSENIGTTIGGNDGKPGNIHISGSVNINAKRTNHSFGPVIGGGYGSIENTVIRINENAKINASVERTAYAAIIGLAEDATGTADITISGRAEVTATSGNSGSEAAIIGTANNSRARANITIEDGTVVKLINRSVATSTDAAGMGLPENVEITNDMMSRAVIKISHFANVDAPGRESYYKDIAGTTPVYKVVASGLVPYTNVTVVYNGKTVTVKTLDDGRLSLYLPLGTREVTIDGLQLTGTVDNSGNSTLGRVNVLVAKDLTQDTIAGVIGINLTGHATSSSDGAITYTITNPGQTGASLTENLLKWTTQGTIALKATQAPSSLYAEGVAVFNVVILPPTADGIRGKLDISKAKITITGTSVTAKTENNTDAVFDADGYEIVGSTHINTIQVRDSVPITINEITLAYNTADIDSGINMVNGGEITLIGTNTISRVDQTGSNGLIGQDSGKMSIIGNGSLNISDDENIGTTIGGNNGKPGNIQISGGVVINAKRTNHSFGPVIGGGYGASANTVVVINDNAKINATMDRTAYAAIIGLAQSSTGSADITISGRAEVIAVGGTNSSEAAILGTANDSNARANITIADGTSVQLVNRATTTSTDAVGMGLPGEAPITGSMIPRTSIKISHFANIDAPNRENYYKDITGTTPVYKVLASGLAPYTDVRVLYNGKTVTVKTFTDGTLSLYLPAGDRNVSIDGENFESTVDDSGNNKMFIKTILRAADITKHASEGLKGINLIGHATTNSKEALVEYKVLDVGKTGASINQSILTWTDPGVARMNVSQAEHGKYSSASADFIVNITTSQGDIKVSISSVGFGRIAVINSNNQEILPFVPAGTAVTLRALPDQGSELAKWVVATDDGKKAITEETLRPTIELPIIAKVNVAYTGYFMVTGTEILPQLDVLEVSSMVIQSDGTTKEQQKPLLRLDGSDNIGFKPDSLEYALYLRSVDDNNININVRHSDKETMQITVGNLAPKDIATFVEYKAPFTLNGSAEQTIPILVRKGLETKQYVLKVYKEQKAENDPHIYAELEANPVKEVLELGIYVMNVDVNAFDVTIKIDELIPSNDRAFEAFVNNRNGAFNNLNTNLAENPANYFNLDSRFEVANMRSDGKFISLTVNIKDGNGVIQLGKTPEKILSIRVRRNPAYKASLINQIDTLKMEPVIKGNLIYDNSLSSKLYGDLNDTYNPSATREEDKKTLSYLEFKAKPENIRMYVSYDANQIDRATFQIQDVSIPGNHKVVLIGDLVNGELIVPVIQSVYRVKILAGGYLLAESQDVVYNGVPSKTGIVMTPVRLFEGDLDNNDVIDVSDRAKLISVLNRKVMVAGSGFVTNTTSLGDEDIYADYNNDNKINSLDLGRLVQNIGKQYGAIHQTRQSTKK